IAGLATIGRWVRVGPPLAANGSSTTAVVTTSVPSAVHDASENTLKPSDTNPAEQSAFGDENTLPDAVIPGPSPIFCSTMVTRRRSIVESTPMIDTAGFSQ